MSILLQTITVGFASVAIWLGVRIVNRRERWAKWTLAAVISLPALYVLSFGPWCWWVSRSSLLDDYEMSCSIYYPIVRIWYDETNTPIYYAIRWYGNLFADPTIDPAEVVGSGNLILGNSP